MARSTSGLASFSLGLVGVIRQITEQCKVQVGVAIGEVADFDFVDDCANLRFAQSKYRHGYEGAELRGHAAAEIELGQGCGGKRW